MQTMLNTVAGFSKGEAGEERFAQLARYRPLALTEQPRVRRILQAICNCYRVKIASIQIMTDAGLLRLAAVSDIPLPAQRRETSITQLCAQAAGVVAVTDIFTHPVLRRNPLAASDTPCRSAVAAPLFAANGHVVGSLSIWDRQQRSFTAEETDLLQNFAGIVSDFLEAHISAIENDKKSAFLQAVFDNPAVGVAVYRGDGARIAVNKRFCGITARPPAELLGRNVADISSKDDANGQALTFSRVFAGETESAANEHFVVGRSEEPIWCKTIFCRMVCPETGEPFVITFVEDDDIKHRAEEARKLLLGEINHRVKNTLAIVQGIARQLQRTPSGETNFCAAFEARVQALARSHDMLTQVSWEPLPLSKLIRQLLSELWEPYRDRFDICTADVALNSQSTVMIWLVLAELATNSVKHGSLRQAEGRVAIRADCEIKKGRTWVRLVWKESGTAIVSLPPRKGLGLYLLERAPKLGLSGTGSVQFEPDGLRFTLEFPVFDKDDIRHQALTGVRGFAAADCGERLNS